MLFLKDIMTTNVVSVRPDTSIIEVAKLLAQHNFNGMPVVDDNNRLLGIITEYDIISKETVVHLPTFQLLVQQLPVFNKDRAHFDKTTKDLMAITVKDLMNREPLALPDTATLEEAVKAFSEHHRVNPIPVINAENTVVGVVSRYDIIKLWKVVS